MISVLLFGFIASACAAPQFHDGFRNRFGPPPFYPDYRHFHPARQQTAPEANNLFDTNAFWSEFSKEIKELDEMMAEFTRRFSTRMSQEGVEGNEYRITITLSGFEEKDIIVKAREGLLMIQAHHKYEEGSERNYLDIRHLPASVNVTGTWSFDKGVLKVVFPLKEGSNPQTVESVNVVSTDFTTKKPTFDREEVVETHDDETVGVQDADVGLVEKDDREVMTNEIPDSNVVEATTYSVDLKDEVEFVPVRY
ncbi:unnamed protein product [Arctia plantaginis]|uniref:SHSP domain-containing protein n=1 Tax=Arctia plantaginis TaxID=874455 RepID=A0A8S1A7N9_ARCPL|nr:unnamed protein product [Arctia plantaginis]CAB3256199.1 unnamed protein product [Arctia plantaginis]